MQLSFSSRTFFLLFLNVLVHLVTGLYLALGPLFFSNEKDPLQTFWISGLIFSSLAKLLFSLVWCLLLRSRDMRALFFVSWSGLLLTTLLFGLYGSHREIDRSLYQFFFFFHSLFATAQVYGYRVWILSHIPKEKTMPLSVFLARSTPVGTVAAFALAYFGFLWRPSFFWPSLYLLFFSLLLLCSPFLRFHLQKDRFSPHDWPNLKEIFLCSLMSGFGYGTYYWACFFLPLKLIEGSSDPLLSLFLRLQSLLYDFFLIWPLGSLGIYLGTKKSLRWSTLTSLSTLSLTAFWKTDLCFLRGALLLAGVLGACAQSAWMKSRVRPTAFFPASSIGGALGALLGSLLLHWAQREGKDSLFQAALPFLLLSLLLFFCNEGREKNEKTL